MSKEQCSQCLREADPPVYIIDGTGYCVMCAAETISVAVQRLAKAVKVRMKEVGP